jgi:hypothetical protein
MCFWERFVDRDGGSEQLRRWRDLLVVCAAAAAKDSGGGGAAARSWKKFALIPY